MNSTVGKVNRKHLQLQLSRTAHFYNASDYVYRHSEKGLFERLEPLKIQPDWILDAGAATGTDSHKLSQHFRKAKVLSLDLSVDLLRLNTRRKAWFSRIDAVQADALRLPVRNHSMDLLYANMLLPWVDSIPAFLGEANRVLKPNGLLVLSTLGENSLQSFRTAWHRLDNYAHVCRFPDMHDLGDLLLGHGFDSPVVDTDPLQVTFTSTERLYSDIRQAGAANCLQGRSPGLTTPRKLKQFSADLSESPCADLEIVYAHAWNKIRAKEGEFRISAQDIGVRRR